MDVWCFNERKAIRHRTAHLVEVSTHCPPICHIDIISNVRKIKFPGQGTSTASKSTNGPRVSPRGDHTIRKDDKEDQPSGGETT